MHFEFAPTPTIIFGNGTISKVPEMVKKLGNHPFVILGLSSGPKDAFLESLVLKGIRYTLYKIQGEPTIPVIKNGLEVALNNKCDVVIGFGGGSAIDTGKTTAALATNPGEILDYLEIIGRGKPLSNPPLPYIAIPTTAGTGAEVTRNAVVGSPEHKIKVSLRSAFMIPRIALVDPELSYSMPPDITAYTGLDALTQLIEPFVSKFSNALTDGFCREGLQRISRSLLPAFLDGTNQKAREDLSLASLLSGLALANSKLGAVHGFAGVIGGLFFAPHGAICSALLPHVVKGNIEALRNHSGSSLHLHRYQEIAQILTSNPNADLEDGVAWLNNLVNNLGIPSLSAYGISKNDFPAIIDKASTSSSMQGNPIKLNESEMNAILTNSL